MLVLVQWANASFSAEYAHGHHGSIQAFGQNAHMSAMGQCKLIGRLLTWAQLANTSSSAENSQQHHGPIQDFWQDMRMGTVGQYKDVHMSTMGQRKLVGRMCAPVQWANTSFLEGYSHEHNGPIQAFVPRANASFSAGCMHQHNGPIQACWQNTHMSTMGQYKLCGRMRA
ncbi:hypothetical protein EDB85DRAFT_1887646 [Lactarius pseudohatsudake]|nr:hypothetical protein EDB85DRAFT_1887646 [Lactarius pseudohatsudake]